MNLDFCLNDPLSFLEELNERTLFYGIVIFVFSSLFSLIWIVKKYTFFEKHRIAKGSTPTFPYGNLKGVIQKDISIHQMLWTDYNRFKKKKQIYGGLYFFIKPMILLVDRHLIDRLLKNGESILPKKSKIEWDRIPEVSLKKCNESVKRSLNSLLETDAFSTIRNSVLESVITTFGWNSSAIEINSMMNSKQDSTIRFNLSLCYSIFRQRTDRQVISKLRKIFVEAMQQRKNIRDNLLQYFIEKYDSTSIGMNEIVMEMFDLFSDIFIYSYSTVIFALYELANNEEVAEELIGHLRRFNRLNPTIIHWNDLEQLSYLNAIVQETFRKYPPISTIIKSYKSCPDEKTLKHLEDFSAIIPVLALHRDPQYYTNPNRFDPDRFVEQTNLSSSPYLPFGIDARNQIVMKFAAMNTKLLLINIFSVWRIGIRKGSSSLHIFRYEPTTIPLKLCENFSFTFERL